MWLGLGLGWAMGGVGSWRPNPPLGWGPLTNMGGAPKKKKKKKKKKKPKKNQQTNKKTTTKHLKGYIVQHREYSQYFVVTI